VRTTTTEQFAPVLRVHAELLREGAPVIDVVAARRRIAAGRVAFDGLRVVRSCGDLTSRFVRVLDAFEVAGFVSNADRGTLLDKDLNVDDLVSGWFTGDRTPRDPQRRVARQVAMVIGNALLRGAMECVDSPSAFSSWKRVVCPCCGGAPDIVLVERSKRTLICARCDAQWRAPRDGCLWCDATESPMEIARISNPALGYDLMMCNSCGRFLKERPRRGVAALLVERALTAELDVAAEQRGLRI
jgi:hypothetical protein